MMADAAPAGIADISGHSEEPTRKRRVDGHEDRGRSKRTDDGGFWPKYLGETVANAHFTVKGEHGIPEGALFQIERQSEQARERTPSPTLDMKMAYASMTCESSKANLAATMRKYQQLKKQENAQRSSSSRGNKDFFRLAYFNRTVARLSNEQAKVFGGLLDIGWVDLRISLIYAAPKVQHLDDMLIRIQVYIRREAFDFVADAKDLEESERARRWISHIFSSVSLRPTIAASANIPKRLQIFGTERSSLSSSSSTTSMASSNSSHSSGSPTVQEKQQKQKDKQEKNNGMITQDEIQSLLDSSSSSTMNSDGMDPKSGVTVPLRVYQRQGLKWMMDKENLVDTSTGKSVIPTMDTHWSQYETTDPEMEDLHFIFWYNNFTGQLSLNFPRAQDQVRGGILADEMGLGKTIQMLSLIHTNRATADDQVIKDEQKYEDDTPQAKSASRGRGSILNTNATLVITPTSLLSQWEEEISTKFKRGSLSFATFYGTDRELTDELMTSKNCPDIVFTTYGIIQREYEKCKTSVGDNNHDRKDADKSNASIGSPIYKYLWRRVVLDEAHYIRNRATGMSKAVLKLNAARRWAVTGTPLQNRIDDLYTLVRFLQLVPWSSPAYWKSAITVPYEKKDPSYISTLQSILEPIMLRRMKSTKSQNGEPIITLPKKIVNVIKLNFDDESRQIYDALLRRSTDTFEQIVKSGMIMKKWVHIFKLLTQLRQFCLHPSLVLGSASNDSEMDDELKAIIAKFENSEQEYVQRLKNSVMDIRSHEGTDVVATTTTTSASAEAEAADEGEEDEEKTCKICFEQMEDPGVLPCMHTFCYGCLVEYMQSREHRGLEGECPVCRRVCCEEDILEVVVNNGPKPDKARYNPAVEGISGGVNNSRNQSEQVELEQGKEDLGEKVSVSVRKRQKFRSSPKLDALVAYLDRIERDPYDLDAGEGIPMMDAEEMMLLKKEETTRGGKVVVFSQYTSFLTIVEGAMESHGVQFLRFDGSMSREKRASVISTFRSDPAVRVLLASSRAAGVGLNLTFARRVVLLDPWWNSAFEQQAIDRVHRLGQHHRVEVVRFVMADSVEERMLAIQASKLALAQAVDTLGERDADGAPEGGSGVQTRVAEVRALLS